MAEIELQSFDDLLEIETIEEPVPRETTVIEEPISRETTSLNPGEVEIQSFDDLIEDGPVREESNVPRETTLSYPMKYYETLYGSWENAQKMARGGDLINKPLFEGIGASISKHSASSMLTGSALNKFLGTRANDPNGLFDFSSLKGTEFEEYSDLFARKVTTNAQAEELKQNILLWKNIDAKIDGLPLSERLFAEAVGMGIAWAFDPLNKLAFKANPFSFGFKKALTDSLIMSGLEQGARYTVDPTRKKEDAAQTVLYETATAAGFYALGKIGQSLFKYTSKVAKDIKDLYPEGGSTTSLPESTPTSPAPGQTDFNPFKTEFKTSTSLAKAVSLGSTPTVRTMFSKSPTVRQLSRSLFKPMPTNIGDEITYGTKTPADITRKRLKDEAMAPIYKAFELNLKDSGLTKDEFNAALTEAMHSGDVHINQSVQKAAQQMRIHIDKLKNELVSRGIINELEFGENGSWGRRVWSQSALIEKKSDFLRMLDTAFDRRLKNAEQKVFDLKNSGRVDEEKLKKAIEELKEAKFDSKASERIYNNIVLDSQNVSGVGGGNIRRHRTLDFITAEEAMPFINKDWMNVHERWVRNAASEIALFDVFGSRETSVSSSKFKDQIIKEIDSWRLPEKKRIQAINEALRDLDALVNIFRTGYNSMTPSNHYNAIDYFMKAFKSYIYLCKLGTAGLSALPDMAAGILENGFGIWAKDGLSVFFKELATLNLKKNELREFLGILHTTQGKFIELGLNSKELYQVEISKFNSMMNRLTDFNSLVNGARIIDEAVQTMNMSLIYNKILKAIKKGDTKTLARYEISESVGKELKAVLDSTGYEIESVMFADFSEAQKAAISDGVRIGMEYLNLNPQAQDLPLHALTGFGRFLYMFKTWYFTLHNKLLVAGIMGNHMRMILAMGMMGVLAVVMHYTKAKMNGREVTEEELIKEFAKGSGSLGIMGMGLDLYSDVTDKDKREPLAPEKQVPAIGVAKDIGDIATKTARGERFSKQDKKKLKRTIPFNNLLGLGQLFNYLIENS